MNIHAIKNCLQIGLIIMIAVTQTGCPTPPPPGTCGNPIPGQTTCSLVCKSLTSCNACCAKGGKGEGNGNGECKESCERAFGETNTSMDGGAGDSSEPLFSECCGGEETPAQRFIASRPLVHSMDPATEISSLPPIAIEEPCRQENINLIFADLPEFWDIPRLRSFAGFLSNDECLALQEDINDYRPLIDSSLEDDFNTYMAQIDEVVQDQLEGLGLSGEADYQLHFNLLFKIMWYECIVIGPPEDCL